MEITKRQTIGTIESSRNNRKLPSSCYSYGDDCNLVEVISAYILPHNVPKETNMASISILEHSKYYSKHKSRSTSHVSRKPFSPPPLIVIIISPPKLLLILLSQHNMTIEKSYENERIREKIKLTEKCNLLEIGVVLKRQAETDFKGNGYREKDATE